MSLALVVALALLQGATEFLPVSSSGHLRLVEAWFGVAEPQTLFDIILHVGTLIPVLIIYRRLFARMVGAAWRVAARRAPLAAEPDARLVLLVGVATVPTGLIGVLVGRSMEALAADVGFVGAALAVNGLILLGLGALARAASAPGGAPRRDLAALTVRDALLIGTIQGVAIFRGISRSGSTITAGLLAGLDRESAAAFSFLLAVPAILGALVLETDLSALANGRVGLYLVGGAVAAASGTVALALLLRLLRGGRLHLFAWYCFALAAAALAWRFGT